MEARLTLAFSGVRHIEDGSLSLLKAFIRQLQADRFPATVRGSLALVLEATRNDEGSRRVELRGMDPDGAETMARQRHTVEIPGGGRSISLLFAIEPDFAGPGDYAFVAMIDGAEHDRYAFTIRARHSTEGDSG